MATANGSGATGGEQQHTALLNQRSEIAVVPLPRVAQLLAEVVPDSVELTPTIWSMPNKPWPHVVDLKPTLVGHRAKCGASNGVHERQVAATRAFPPCSSSKSKSFGRKSVPPARREAALAMPLPSLPGPRNSRCSCCMHVQHASFGSQSKRKTKQPKQQNKTQIIQTNVCRILPMSGRNLSKSGQTRRMRDSSWSVPGQSWSTLTHNSGQRWPSLGVDFGPSLV